MSKISIELDITTLGLVTDPETGEIYPGTELRDSIVEQLVRSVTGGDVGRLIRKSAEEAVAVEVKDAIAKILEGEFLPTDHYGNARGEKITLRGLVTAAIDRWISPGDARTNYNSNNRGTMGQLVEEVIKREAKPEIDAAVKDAISKVSHQVTQTLVGGVAELVQKQAERR